MEMFLDTYNGYRQMWVRKEEDEKITFYTNGNTFCY